MYSPTLSLTSALDVVCGQRHNPADLSPRKDSMHIVEEAGWARVSGWIGVKNLVTTGARSPDGPSRSDRVATPTELSRSTKSHTLTHRDLFFPYLMSVFIYVKLEYVRFS
jgi:hypothetical protein